MKLTSEKPASAIYRNRYGDTVACIFDGLDEVNGNLVDYQAWPTLESPWTNQKIPAGPLEITDGKTVRTYDFTKWTEEDHSN